MSTTTHTIHNFSAGPCILPPSVLRQASEAVNDLDGSGLSLIEISHRSKPFVAIMEEARQLVRTELALPDHYEVLFLQGGASLGFLTAAMNFLPESGSMDYTVTGTWAKKALKEAQRVGQAKALTSSEETGFDRVPTIARAHRCRLRPHHHQQHHLRYAVSGRPAGGCAADRGHELGYFLTARRRHQVCLHLCRRPEKHGPCGHGTLHL